MNHDEPGRLVLVRHGETSWSRQRRHTGRSDIPLDTEGRIRAAALRPALASLADIDTATILVSPLRRARETASLAGLGDRGELCDDLLEWDYGDYEGRRTSEIRTEVPGWSIWSGGVPNGETIDQIAARADRVIERSSGPLTVLFAHATCCACSLRAGWGCRPTAGAASLSRRPVSRSSAMSAKSG